MPTPSQPARIVLAIGDVGGGHRSAARALTTAIESRYADRVSVHTEDLFAILDPAPSGDSNRYQRRVAGSGPLGSRWHELLWHLENGRLSHGAVRLYLRIRTLNAYRQRLQELAPDVVISLHPHVAQAVAAVQADGVHFRHAVVVTDLVTLPRSWAVPSAEWTVYPTPAARRALERFGLPSDRLLGPLYPLPSRNWGSPAAAAATESVAGLLGEGPLVLFTAGGNGMSSLAPAAIELAERGRQRVLVVCGKDAGTEAALAARWAERPHARALGFVDHLIDLMAAADLVVTKAGPATILELELLERRALLVGNIGPQESGNVAYALENPRFRNYLGPHRGLLPIIDAQLAASLPDFRPRRRIDESETIAEALAGLWAHGPERGASVAIT
jgi:UDP-N-acetylglucosamine:LPS N-acetylglucosamine transferase